MGNIVWLASYPKSGNTWMRAFIYNLVENPSSPGRLDSLPAFFEDESKPRWYQPYTRGRAVEDLSFDEVMAIRPQVHRDIADSQLQGSVFTKTHNMFGQLAGLPIHNISVMAGAVYVVRNPLDVVLSLADHFGLSIDEAIDFMGNEETGMPTNAENVAGYTGSWSTHVASWTAQPHPSIVVLRYEDLKDKPLKTFQRVANIQGMGRDRKRVKKAIEFSDFRVLKAQENKMGFVERSPHSQSFFRQGRKNQWVDVLDDEQVKRVIDRHREQMQRFRYIPAKFK